MHFLLYIKFHEYILNGLGEHNYYILKSKRGIILQSRRCSYGSYSLPPSNDVFRSFNVTWKYLWQFQSYKADTNFILNLTKEKKYE